MSCGVDLASAQKRVTTMQILLEILSLCLFPPYKHCNATQVNNTNVSLCISCVKKSRGCRRCRCTCVHVDDPEHPDAFLYPGEKFHSVTAAHTRWLSKEGQVVVLSAAQSSVDAAHADICLR